MIYHYHMYKEQKPVYRSVLHEFDRRSNLYINL